jgi:hypothetical protein
MPAPYHTLHRRLENVLKAFLKANTDIDLHVYNYLDVVALGCDVEEPFLGIRCQHSVSATPEAQLPISTGSRTVTASLKIRSHALNITNGRDPLSVVQEFRDYHDTLVGKVLDCFFQDNLISVLNSFCQTENGIGIDQVDQFDITDTPEDRSGVTEITLPIWCHPQEWEQ